ncbi:TetR/AcrR family transcriptional regulator [uncultured Jannaschia sp.]|uniref:TetR/AcrR family transcriptional regulator n=1 Tax=uncultured Jannaschia sp. TaxID=293347 RepID=UPI0026323D48|nr:TetR/AcrR family transcriptional regulator [uncultured Jannaschia sp.]
MDAPPESRLGPNAWIDAAYAAFERGGVGAIRVDPLAKALGITRGSFYWHFKDRQALLRAVINRWDATNTEATIAENEAVGGAPAARLLRLLRTCATDDGRFEIGIRAWAKDDAGARSILERIDGRRIGYMARLATEAGVAEEDARIRARVGYLAWLGSYMNAVSGDQAQRLADMDGLWHMMLEDAAIA